MKKLFATVAICILTSVSCFAQYTTTYRDQYGNTTGTATRSSSYGGTTITYRDQYGNLLGTSTEW